MTFGCRALDGVEPKYREIGNTTFRLYYGFAVSNNYRASHHPPASRDAPLQPDNQTVATKYNFQVVLRICGIEQLLHIAPPPDSARLAPVGQPTRRILGVIG